MAFLAGFASGVFVTFGSLGLLCAFVAAAWRDGMIKHLNGGHAP